MLVLKVGIRRDSEVYREMQHRLHKGTSINLLRTMITSLVSARNPHVLACTLRFLCSVRLVLKVLTTINRGTHKL